MERLFNLGTAVRQLNQSVITDVEHKSAQFVVGETFKKFEELEAKIERYKKERIVEARL